MRFYQFAIISPIFLFINIFYGGNLLSETNTNSIIKIFCKESVKSEYNKNNFEYKESIGEDVCNCYLKNILNNISRKESISKCKLEEFKKN